MPIADYSTYVAEVSAPFQRIQDTKNSITTAAGRMYSLFVTAPLGGSAPTSAAACNSTLAGSIGQMDSSGVQRIAQIAASLGNSAYVLVCDRLSHQGGLSGTATGAQTTNLATAALTRYTDGVGVMAALEIYTLIGTTATTVTASYTNEAGSSGQTSVATVWGGTAFREASRFIPLPLQQGDLGVKAVASVTAALSTGTAGNFGVTLFKPLFGMPIPNMGSQQFLFDSILNMGGNMPQIVNGACLFYVVVANTTSTGILQNAVRIIEE